MVSTSANPSGKPSATTRLKVMQYFQDKVDLIVPGRLGGQSGVSEIRDLVTGETLRASPPQGSV
jgi:L-threonylcarbamoyladenylate synthase